MEEEDAEAGEVGGVDCAAGIVRKTLVALECLVYFISEERS